MTAREWTEIAVRMQRRANLADMLGRGREAGSYRRRRDYCANKATGAGGQPWAAISNACGEIALTLETI